MFTAAFFMSLAAASLSFVDAHGIVQTMVVDGTTYTSPDIGEANTANSPFWIPNSNSPVTDLTSDTLFCGASTVMPTGSVDVSAGSEVQYTWKSGYAQGSNWPHNTGPMFLYIAKCDGDCTDQTASSTSFIKVAQQGFDDSGAWTQAQLYAGEPAVFTVPSDLEAGSYLFRHEVVNLASTIEMYPACQNMNVTGSGTNSYSTAATASFPGAYSATDPGLSVAGSAVYSIKSNAEYTFPGPAPITDDTTTSSGSDTSSSTSSAAASGASAASVAGVGAGIATGVASGSAESSAVAATGAASVTTSAADTSATTTASSTDSSSASSGCATAWTQCNSDWMTAGANGTYTCQDDFQSCESTRRSLKRRAVPLRSVHRRSRLNHY